MKYDPNRLSNYKLAGAYSCINMPFAVLNETLTDKDDELRGFCRKHIHNIRLGIYITVHLKALICSLLLICTFM